MKIIDGKRVQLSTLLWRFNELSKIPWVFYDIETFGLHPTEKISINETKGTFWIHKPCQITQLSALVVHPISGRKGIDWAKDFAPVTINSVYYKKSFKDLVSRPNEFNEKALLSQTSYDHLSLEKIVQSYISCFHMTDLDIPRQLHYSICKSVRKIIEKKELSEPACRILELQIEKFNAIAREFWLSDIYDRKTIRKELFSTLSRLTSIIISEKRKDILNNSKYFSEHYPDGTEEEVLINFDCFIRDALSSCGCKNALFLGQNNSGFDHRFLDARSRIYGLPHRNNPEFDLRILTRYFFHPICEKERLTETSKNGKQYLTENLSSLAKYFELSDSNWHNSIYDARLTSHIFLLMMRTILEETK